MQSLGTFNSVVKPIDVVTMLAAEPESGLNVDNSSARFHAIIVCFFLHLYNLAWGRP